MGLFSTLDALLDMDMEEALKGVNLSPRITAALLHSQGELSVIRQIIDSQERGDWEKLDLMASLLNVSEEDVYGYYMKAVRWAKDVMELLYD